MIRLFVAVLDVLLLTMLVTFAVDAQDRRAVPQKRWLLAAAVTWLLLAIATVLDSDPLYILVMAAYVLVCVVSLTTQARLRTLVATAFLTLIAGFPLNVIVFVLNVLGVDIVFGHDHALYALAALMNVLVIFWVWRQRRRFSDQLAIRFSIGECLMIVVLFLLTTLLGLVMNPTNGELDPNVLATASGHFLVTMLTALVIFLNVFFLVMVWRRKTTTYYRAQSALQAQYTGMELQYFESYKEAQADIRAFRHDMKHHMAHMAQLCDTGDAAALANYLAHFQQEWQDTAYRLYQTGNDVIDAILNGRAGQMRKAQIALTIDGAFTSPLTLTPFDLCTIFANAIDNALEENARLPETSPRWLTITIRQNQSFYVVTLENPLAAPLPTHLRTRKRDTRNHGFGLHNIRDKAEKNGGSIDIHQTDDRYQLNIFLPRHPTHPQ